MFPQQIHVPSKGSKYRGKEEEEEEQGRKKSRLNTRTHTPDAAVLTAYSCVFSGWFHIHVVQRGLPHHMMSPCEF